MYPLTAALVQRFPTTGEFINHVAYSAWYGLQKMGLETRAFTGPGLIAGETELSKDVLVVGGVESVRYALDKLGCPAPNNIDYPPCLEPIFHRKIVKGLLGNLDFDTKKPVFIKPITGHKEFNGHVIARYRDLIRTASFPADTEIWVSDVVDFESEHRYCVNRGEVLGSGFYRGDPTMHPDTKVVRWAVEQFEASGAAPVSYTIDLGVIRQTGETALVEVNDGFAFGPYGLDPIKHAAMLRDRWCEMVGFPIC